MKNLSLCARLQFVATVYKQSVMDIFFAFVCFVMMNHRVVTSCNSSQVDYTLESRVVENVKNLHSELCLRDDFEDTKIGWEYISRSSSNGVETVRMWTCILKPIEVSGMVVIKQSNDTLLQMT